ALELGSTALDDQTFTSHAADLQALRAALAPGGELLLWGCDVAQGPQGQAFLQDLSRASGAPVAASTHLIGAAALGGSWDLDASAGAASADVPFSAAARAAFVGVLPWVQAAPMRVARSLYTATLLQNGKVLVVGGEDASSHILASAELYDRATNSWS